METMIGVPIGAAHYIIFVILLLFVVSLYLGIIHSKAHIRSLRESIAESVIWLVLALAFGIGFWFSLGKHTAAEFGYGFFVESLLSLDNLLIFSVIFSFYGVPEIYQSFLLAWSVLIMIPARGLLVAAGSVLLIRFGWLTYIFGGLLILAGLKYFFDKKTSSKSRILKTILKSDIIRRFGFTTFSGKVLLVSPLLVIATVETIDALAAIDSISASYVVSHNPFIVFSSNVLAALTLRSLYFVVNGLVRKHPYLITSLAMVSVLIGLEMIASHFISLSILFTIILDIMMIIIPVVIVIIDKKVGGFWNKIILENTVSKPRWPLRSKL